MRRFFVASAHIDSAHTVIAGNEFHHLKHVLHLGCGDHIVLLDELGREHAGRIVALSATTAEVTILGSTPPPSPRLSLTLALGLLKGQKMDLVVEKTTELGVSCILPFTSAFTVAELPSARQQERLARWRRIAHSAAKQSGSRIPHILPPQPLDEILMSSSQAMQHLLFYEQEYAQTLKVFAAQQPQVSSLCVIVGPEGGFAAEEIALARRAHVAIVGLGSQILRAETAGIVAVALCRFLWEDTLLPER